MPNLSRRRTPVQEVLRKRPYLRWDLLPLAAYLCKEGYHEHSRNRIIDQVADGRPLHELCTAGYLEPADLAGAEKYLRRGKRRARSRSGRAARAVRSVGDLLNVLVGSLRACGVEPEQATLDETGFDIDIGAGPLRIAFTPRYTLIDDGYLDHLTDEQIDRLHDEHNAPELPEDFPLTVLPIRGGAPEYEPTDEDLADMDAACRSAELLDALRHDDDAHAESDRYRGR